MKDNQKGLAHIVAAVVISLVAILMVAAGWYFEENREVEPNEVAEVNGNTNSQTNDVTEWNNVSYDSTLGTFSLDVPQDWEVNNQPEHNQERRPFVTAYIEHGSSLGSMTVSYYLNAAASLEEWVEDHKRELIQGHEEIIDSESAVLADDRLIVAAEMKNVFKHMRCYIQAGDLLYEIYFFSEIANWSEYEAAFERACNSFTVTRDGTDSTAVDTSGWLTYENEEYGFSFTYPVDYSEQIWTGSNEDLGLLFEWGMNKGHETVISIKVTPLNSKEVLRGETDIVYTHGDNQMVVYSSYANQDEELEETRIYKEILKSLEFTTPATINTSEVNYHIATGPEEGATISNDVIVEGETSYIGDFNTPSGWKTHSDDIHDYTFRYPSDWSINTSSDTYADVVVSPPGALNLNDGGLLIAERASPIVQSFLVNTQNYFVNGNRGLRAQDARDQDLSFIYTYLPNSTSFYVVIWKKEYQSQYSEFERILSTFKFEYDTSAELNKYINKMDGYSLTFPEKWQGYTYIQEVGAYRAMTFSKKINASGEIVKLYVVPVNRKDIPFHGFSWIDGQEYKFVFSMSEEPTDPQAKDVWNEIPSILASFQLE